jgi:cobalt/nickel transport system ATP-binding protein
LSGALIDARGLVVDRGGRRVLDGADLALHAGERVGLGGANGAGKTTLLRTLVGLERPRAGTVTAFGQERVSERDFHEVRLRAGYLFQDPDDQLFCATVLEDVAFGPLNRGLDDDAAHGVAAATLARLDLAHLAERVTHRLSGGEKRLAALAGVLALEPEVLLLDEPTGGLDADHRARLLDRLAALPQAMLIVSHDPGFLDALATRRLLLADGRPKAAEATTGAVVL